MHQGMFKCEIKAAPHCQTMLADTSGMSYFELNYRKCERLSVTIGSSPLRCHSILPLLYHSLIIFVRLTSVSCSLWPRWPTVWPLMTYITPVTWESVTSPT